MLKRKGTTTSDDNVLTRSMAKKTRKTPWRTPADKKGNIDTTTAEALLQSMLGSTTTENFFKDVWEQKPLYVERGDEMFYGEMFGLEVAKSITQSNSLSFLLDVNVSTYVDGMKVEYVEESGEVSVEAIDRMMTENKATFQFSHPQRYIDDLWNIMEKLESYFGCLWGAHAYITPPGSQGFAPHCDDVENFILQLEGESEWKLFTPMVQLSRDYTLDLLEESLGEPMQVVTLKPGDMLYFPRGIIYLSKASEKGHSTHVTLSTYQQNSWGDFLSHAMEQAIENALEDDIGIRKGLPINFRTYLGTAKNMSAYVAQPDDETKEDGEENTARTNTEPSNLTEPRFITFKETVRKSLENLVDHIDVNKAADVMCSEFMACRLPPYGHYSCDAHKTEIDEPNGESDTKGGDAEVAEKDAGHGDDSAVVISSLSTSSLSLTDEIKIKFPDHFRVVYVNDDDEDSSDATSLTDSQVDDEDMEEGTSKEETDKPKKKSKSTTSETDDADVDDDDDDDADLTDTPYIKVFHSLLNDRFTHMVFNIFSRVGCLNFDVSCAKALVALNSSTEFVPVKDLQVDSDDGKLALANKLAADGLLEVKSIS